VLQKGKDRENKRRREKEREKEREKAREKARDRDYFAVVPHSEQG